MSCQIKVSQQDCNIRIDYGCGNSCIFGISTATFCLNRSKKYVSIRDAAGMEHTITDADGFSDLKTLYEQLVTWKNACAAGTVTPPTSAIFDTAQFDTAVFA